MSLCQKSRQWCLCSTTCCLNSNKFIQLKRSRSYALQKSNSKGICGRKVCTDRSIFASISIVWIALCELIDRKGFIYNENSRHNILTIISLLVITVIENDRYIDISYIPNETSFLTQDIWESFGLYFSENVSSTEIGWINARSAIFTQCYNAFEIKYKYIF